MFYISYSNLTTDVLCSVKNFISHLFKSIEVNQQQIPWLFQKQVVETCWGYMQLFEESRQFTLRSFDGNCFISWLFDKNHRFISRSFDENGLFFSISDEICHFFFFAISDDNHYVISWSLTKIAILFSNLLKIAILFCDHLIKNQHFISFSFVENSCFISWTFDKNHR